MASDKLRPGPKCYAIDPKRITLRLYPNNTGTPTWEAEGGVASVARSAAGKFLVTLDQPYYKPMSANATVQCNSDAVDLYAQLGDFSNATHNSTAVGTPGQPTTFVVKLKTGGTNTDIAAATQTCVFIDVAFEDIAR